MGDSVQIASLVGSGDSGSGDSGNGDSANGPVPTEALQASTRWLEGSKGSSLLQVAMLSNIAWHCETVEYFAFTKSTHACP